MSSRKSDKKVEKVAWFMANFQCVDLDDSSFERIRELLSHCRGSKTRVALSKTDGWKSGKNSLLHKHKKKKVPLSCIHNLIQDEKFINVLLCVFAVQCADSDDPKLEVVAFKFRSPEDALDIVTRFREWTDTLPLEGSVNDSVLISRSTAMPMPGRPTTGNLTPSQWTSPSSSAAPRPYLSSSANDLTSAGVFYGHQQPTANAGSEPRRMPPSDRRTLPSDDGSVVLSETDMNGIAVARVSKTSLVVDGILRKLGQMPAGTGAGIYSADTAKAVPLFQVVRLSM